GEGHSGGPGARSGGRAGTPLETAPPRQLADRRQRQPVPQPDPHVRPRIRAGLAHAKDRRMSAAGEVDPIAGTGRTMYDVVVVGAGPAGLYTALRTAEEGLEVVVLEEHEDVGVPTHCTGLISGETNSLYKIPEDIVLN